MLISSTKVTKFYYTISEADFSNTVLYHMQNYFTQAKNQPDIVANTCL